ncbi:MAG: nucleotidyltransferase domain-containing protein [Chloroflexi bacterium]|nr:nucleotidyltransferase domain-containing protein [Chloroflexota bacterium]
MQPLIEEKRSEIAALCRRFYVRRLEVFGSAAGDDFDPDRSDVDLLVEFEPDFPMAALDAYFGFKEAMETLLGRPVDLVMPSAIRNPFLRESIDRSRALLYAA